MKILFIGDIVGRPGRAAVKSCLGQFRNKVDLVIANGENAAGGMGLTFDVADELFAMGIDVITMGNHVWDKKEIFEFIGENDRIVRPLNYPGSPPGKGWTTVTSPSGIEISVINACGRVFNLTLLDDPFRAIDRALDEIKKYSNVVIVDFHAEATSEKIALGHYLDGRVTAVIGTHTHVQTADATVLSGGTGYVTDTGMTGPFDSVIGIKKEIVIERFLSQLPSRFDVAPGPWQFCGVLLEVDEVSGRCLSINSICQREKT